MRGRIAIRLALASLLTMATVAWPHAPSEARDDDGAGGGDRSATTSVIVAGRAGQPPDQVRNAVLRAGGDVERELPIVDGVAAEVPLHALDDLRAAPEVRNLSADSPVAFQATTTSSPIRSATTRTVGAHELWDAGTTGRGVTVAVLDTGIAEVADLAGRIKRVTDPVTGRQSSCANFAGDGTCDDAYGHGTFMAGIIAGDGTSSGGRWTGVAPEADLVAVKVAGRDGAADVSQVLAGIQWVVAEGDALGIDVLNLSLGTDSTQSWEVDPLNLAVERAWEAGITVVVSASNRGPTPGTIAKPADDPWVVTVGAIDDRGTPGTGDDRVPDFSSRGPTADGLAKPDVVAPGAHVVSLRSPGSAIDDAFPAPVDGAYRQGSGTSMAAAVVSGAAALLLQDDPGRAPGDVKGALTTSARPTASDDGAVVGAGLVDLPAARGVAPGTATTSGPGRSSGLGALDASRGSVRVTTTGLLPTVVSGVLTAQLLVWDPVGFVTGGWASMPLSEVTWLLARWNDVTWYGDHFAGAALDGHNWHGHNWHGHNWHGHNWHGTWEGSSSTDDEHGDTYGSPGYGAAWYGLWE